MSQEGISALQIQENMYINEQAEKPPKLTNFLTLIAFLAPVPCGKQQSNCFERKASHAVNTVFQSCDVKAVSGGTEKDPLIVGAKASKWKL